jgi:sporulation protein YlmC with PRC-barrel domain
MKVLLASLLVVPLLGLTLDASAQTTSTRQTWKNTGRAAESSEVIGAHVKNTEGKDVGAVEQLIIDPATGRVTYAVIGSGGVAGVGETHLIVPFSDVKVNVVDKGDQVVVTVADAALDKAQRYDKRSAVADRDKTSPSASPSTSTGQSDKK